MIKPHLRVGCHQVETRDSTHYIVLTSISLPLCGQYTDNKLISSPIPFASLSRITILRKTTAITSRLRRFQLPERSSVQEYSYKLERWIAITWFISRITRLSAFLASILLSSRCNATLSDIRPVNKLTVTTNNVKVYVRYRCALVDYVGHLALCIRLYTWSQHSSRMFLTRCCVCNALDDRAYS